MSDSNYYMPPASYRRDDGEERTPSSGDASGYSNQGVKRESTWRPSAAASKNGAPQPSSSARPTNAWATRDSPRSSSPGPSSARRTDSYYEPPSAPRSATYADNRDSARGYSREATGDKDRGRDRDRPQNNWSRLPKGKEDDRGGWGEYNRRQEERRRASGEGGGYGRRRDEDDGGGRGGSGRQPYRERGAEARERDMPTRDRQPPARERELPVQDRDFAPRDRDFTARDVRNRDPPTAPRHNDRAQHHQRDQWRGNARGQSSADHDSRDEVRNRGDSPTDLRRGVARRASPDYGTSDRSSEAVSRRYPSPSHGRRRSPTPDTKRRGPPSPDLPQPKRQRDLSPPRRGRSPISDHRYSSRSPSPAAPRRGSINGRGRGRSPESLTGPRHSGQRLPSQGRDRGWRSKNRQQQHPTARSPPRAPWQDRDRDAWSNFRQTRPNHPETAPPVRMRKWGRPSSHSPTRSASPPPRGSQSPRSRVPLRSPAHSARSDGPPEQWRQRDDRETPNRHHDSSYAPAETGTNGNGRDASSSHQGWKKDTSSLAPAPFPGTRRSPQRPQSSYRSERGFDDDDRRQPPRLQRREQWGSPAMVADTGSDAYLDRLADKEREYDQHLSTVAPYVTAAFRQWYAQDASPELYEFLGHYFGRQPSRLELDQVEQLLSLRKQLTRDQTELRGLHTQAHPDERSSPSRPPPARLPPSGPRAAQPPSGPRGAAPSGPRSDRMDDSRDVTPVPPFLPPGAPGSTVGAASVALGAPPLPPGALPLPPFPPPSGLGRPPLTQASPSLPPSSQHSTPHTIQGHIVPSTSALSQSHVSRPATTGVYERLAQVGEGTYGKVYKARNVETGALVALKRIRMEQEKDGFPITSMREIKLLQALRHPNVVRLSEMMVSKGSVYMVLEYMNHDLTGILSHPEVQLSPANIKSLNFQMLSGLGYLHKRGILHRDMKGSNILLNGAGELKLADFGLARWYHKHKRDDYTNRVITLWYRSPELLMGETCYGPEVDTWSAGCIMLEIFTTKPVFQGTDELNQLEVIYAAMGTPDEKAWPRLPELPWYELVRPREHMSSHFRSMFSKWMSPAALNLAEGLLKFNPAERLLADDALQTPYFTTEEPAMEPPRQLATYSEHHEMTVKLERHRRREAK